ncbi:MAG TPA: allantoate amidohydrolase [Lacunisphaera sp.]|jgi:allantoate deiminase|nr:allantoate amidohydrolase [Lacunisphaera sp.]HQY04732.1 allantoate amidohydrolase [Lacunisphaera sp.]
MSEAAQLLVSMLDELGHITDEPGRITRTFLSPAMRRANRLVGDCMIAAGLEVREDSVGNLIGRLEAAKVGRTGPVRRGGAGRSALHKTLLIGSHLDTVRDAGRFDGPLGVLLPIVALADLKVRGVKLPFNVEVLGFSEEEGVRFGSAYLGSEGYTGRLRSATLKLRDADGISVGDVLREFNDGKFSLPKPAHSISNLLGYIEVHIEQGPVLDAKKLAVGVVSAIAGQSRFKLTWTGKAGHAGTTPMALRKDALAGAAEFTLAAEKLARGTAGLVATVGSLAVSPGAANVIPGSAVHTLDVRHAKDTVRRTALFKLGRLATQIANKRGLKVSWQRTQDNGAVACSPVLTAALERSVKAVQGKSLSLVSGAGHDGVVMSSLTPVAMLFVRCRDGLSHHPDEHASPKDLAVALDVMVDFLQQLATDYTNAHG